MEGSKTLAPGTLLGSRYELIRAIGEGSMGAVYEAVQVGIGRRVALKTVKAGSHQQARRLAREAQAAGALNHPNIVQVNDVHIDTSGVSFLVMELLEGQSVEAIAAEGRMEPARVVRMVRQVLDALQCAHQANIVHRDLKPANLFVTKTGTLGEVVKVLDFGVAKLEARYTQLTEAGNIVGTPLYMAPEQIRGGIVSGATDLWSVGVLLHELLAGHPPFSAGSWQDLLGVILKEAPVPLEKARPGLPAPLYSAVRRALEKATADRLSTADEMDRLLQAAETQLGVKSRPALKAITSPTQPRRTAVQGGSPKSTERIGSLNEDLAELHVHQPKVQSGEPLAPSPLDLRNLLSTGEKGVLTHGEAEDPDATMDAVHTAQTARVEQTGGLPPPPRWLFVALGVGFVGVLVGLMLLFLLV
ncbi:MAG: serine/threonine-protein kinase [Polyangiales bacterium]